MNGGLHKMVNKIQLTIEVDQEEFFKNWNGEQLENLPEHEKQRIIKWFINRQLSLKRDGYSCQNQKCETGVNNISMPARKEHVTVHHIIPRRDFKENPQSLTKRLGYDCDDMQNLATLCKQCHVNYERGHFEIVLDGQPYKLDKPKDFDYKKMIFEGKKLRQNLKKLGQVGWYGLTEEERTNLIIILMRWITKEWTEISETMDDDDYNTIQ